MKIKKLINFLSSPKLFFYACFWLFVLLVIGTLVQKDIGLYQAQKIYFSSWIIWCYDWVPLPGGYVPMGMILVGLSLKLFYKSPVNKRTVGTFITHIGALMLLFGGLLTAMFGHEGSMVIPEGKSVDYYQDYHRLEIAIIDTSNPTEDKTYAFQDGWIKEGKVLSHSDLPFKLEILKYCRNCNMIKRSLDVNSSLKYRGFSKNFKLVDLNLRKEDSENRGGISFRVRIPKLYRNKESLKKEGLYSIVESMPVDQTLSINGNKYIIEIRHQITKLPFEIKLMDFMKKNHAGTGMAKSYKSEILLLDKGLSQRNLIQMNDPLRYRGYTFYQASFIEGKNQTTILAVVKNVGRLFPYISSIIMCIGLFFHLIISSPKLFKSEKFHE